MTASALARPRGMIAGGAAGRGHAAAAAMYAPRPAARATRSAGWRAARRSGAMRSTVLDATCRWPRVRLRRPHALAVAETMTAVVRPDSGRRRLVVTSAAQPRRSRGTTRASGRSRSCARRAAADAGHGLPPRRLRPRPAPWLRHARRQRRRRSPARRVRVDSGVADRRRRSHARARRCRRGPRGQPAIARGSSSSARRPGRSRTRRATCTRAGARRWPTRRAGRARPGRSTIAATRLRRPRDRRGRVRLIASSRHRAARQGDRGGLRLAVRRRRTVRDHRRHDDRRRGQLTSSRRSPSTRPATRPRRRGAR